MYILILLGIIFFILGLLIKLYKVPYIEKNVDTVKNYKTKNYIMTETELKFYKQLKSELKNQNLNYNIFPQLNLESIIQVKNYSNSDRNRIKSRSIDFTITSEDNCKIICCIELDNFTHNQKNRIQRDIFINNLFEFVNIKLLRIPVKNIYDINSIIKQIEEVI